MTSDDPDLHAAYALSTPDDSKRLYAKWADTYDQDFAAANDYQLHLHTARTFVELGGKGPVLDVGAGTGLCGDALCRLGLAEIDATDISSEMLDQAARKNTYRALFAADITRRLPCADSTYAGIVSSGTFTTGHVGPEAIEELIRIAQPGGLVTLSINTKHFESEGFDRALAALKPRAPTQTLTETRIYGSRASGPNKDDTALIATLTKA
jgi:predicted TPR repeat methyltransferase